MHTEHEGFAHNAVALCLFLLLVVLELNGHVEGLELFDAGGGAIENGDLADLLVRVGENILEFGVTLPELVAATLLGLDALSANSLAAGSTIKRTVSKCHNC